MHSLISWLTAAYVRLTVRDEEGQGLVEYALIIALIAIMLVLALTVLQGGIEGIFTDISASLT